MRRFAGVGLGWMAVVLALAGNLPAEPEQAEIKPLTRAHAHNDYEHRRPLLDALDRGFCSVEADIFLVRGELMIGHHWLDLGEGRTLEALYLKPLAARAAANGGKIYPQEAPFYLLIDIKTDAAETYAVLRKQLAKYATMLTTVRDGQVTPGAVTVVISGDCPRDLITKETERHCAIDGRMGDLNSTEPVHLVPWISNSWQSQFQWDGRGEMPEEERQKLARIVEQTRTSGRKLRFWGSPDNAVAWKAFYEAGVDLINTDDLAGLQEFLLKQ